MCVYIYIYIYLSLYIYIYVILYYNCNMLCFVISYYMMLYYMFTSLGADASEQRGLHEARRRPIVAIFYPFSQFCEIDVSLLSLQNHQEKPSIYFRRR